MRYSIEPIDRKYVKRYGFLSFAKTIGNNLSNKYGQKHLDSAKKSPTDEIKTASKRVIQKTAKANGGLTGNKIADKITSVSKKSLSPSQNDDANSEIKEPKKRYIYLQKKDYKLLMN